MKCYYPQTYNDNCVSCGRCAACRQNRINGWVARLERECRYRDTAHFITLTYADKQCTKTNNNLLTLDYSHIKQFIKRYKNLQNAKYKRQLYLREKHPEKNIQCEKPYKLVYFCSGEYGSKNKQTPRPHYHLIMFDTDVNLIASAWCYKDKNGWHSRGTFHTGDTNSGSIRYSLKYISKPSRIPLFHGDDRTREFSHMSKGIGKNYLTKAIIKWHRADILNRYYVPGNGGIKIPMPRYYADKIYTKDEKQKIAENLENQLQRNFQKEISKDINFIQQYIQARNYQEKKLNNPKISQLC